MKESMTIEQRVDAANAKVLEIMTKGHPVWVDVQPAIDVIPGMTKTTILTPGPGITPDRVTPPPRSGATLLRRPGLGLQPARRAAHEPPLGPV